MDKQVLFMFKAPLLGNVKTRIAQDTSNEFALEVYRKMGKYCFDQCKKEVESWVFFSPSDQENLVRSWISDATFYQSQVDGHLGHRISTASKQAFSKNSKAKQIIVGADCPFITSEVLDQVWVELDKNEVVIGPTFDGGYYLIATNSYQPDLFEGISWSTEKVYKETLEIIVKKSFKYHALEPFFDVDTVKDWDNVLKFIDFRL